MRHVTGRPTRGSEQGSALVLAVVMLVMASMVVGVVAAAAIGTTNRSKERKDRVTGLPIADSAISTWEMALAAKHGSSAGSYVLDESTLQDLLPPGSSVQRNDDLPFPQMRVVDGSVPATGRVTAVEPLDASSNGYWQVYAIRPPQPGDELPALTVYLRAWAGDPTTGSMTRPRTVRARFTSSQLEQYALIVDNQIYFTDGVDIDGWVHSNGHEDSTYETAGNEAHRIWHDNSGGVRCAAGSVITTADGTVHMPSSCDDVQQDQPEIGFAAMRTAIRDLAAACATGTAVRCIAARTDGSEHVVQLNGTQIEIDGASSRIDTRTIVLVGDARIAGDAPRVSIASIATDGPNGSGSITLTGDVGSAGHSIGLYAEGDVIVDPTSCAVREVHASLIAPNGSLLLDPSLARGSAQQSVVDRLGRCASLLIEGTVALEDAPMLQMTIGGRRIGYDRRSYTAPTATAGNPPPAFLLSSGWSFESWSEANPDCFGSRRGDSTCR